MVEDASGRSHVRRQFILQFGAETVTYLSDAHKRIFVVDTINVVLSYAKCHIEAEAWTFASTNAQALTKQWLHMRATVICLDVRAPTRVAGAPNMLQVIAFLL